jgi:hypothetical protein
MNMLREHLPDALDLDEAKNPSGSSSSVRATRATWHPWKPNGNHDRSQTTFEVWFSGLAASECHPTFLLCAMDHCKPQRCQEKVHLWTNHLDIYTFVNGFKVVVHSLSCTKQRWQHPVPKYPGVRRMKGNLQQTAVAHGFLSGFLVKQRT